VVGQPHLRNLGARRSARYGEIRASQIPMPCLVALSGAGILERMVLEPLGRQSYAITPRKEPLAVGRDQVRHRPTEPHVSMQPETAVHGVDHSVATTGKLLPL
jgi:hypothetical protein